jgi:hypothetical protein
MSTRRALLLIRSALLVTALFSVGGSLLLTEKIQKIIASASGGALIGFFTSLLFEKQSKTTMGRLAEVNNKIAEARRILEQGKSARWWNYGSTSPLPTRSSPRVSALG